MVPTLWKLEIANSLTMAVRRGRIDREFRRAALSDLATPEITTDPHAEANAWSCPFRSSHCREILLPPQEPRQSRHDLHFKRAIRHQLGNKVFAQFTEAGSTLPGKDPQRGIAARPIVGPLQLKTGYHVILP